MSNYIIFDGYVSQGILNIWKGDIPNPPDSILDHLLPIGSVSESMGNYVLNTCGEEGGMSILSTVQTTTIFNHKNNDKYHLDMIHDIISKNMVCILTNYSRVYSSNFYIINTDATLVEIINDIKYLGLLTDIRNEELITNTLLEIKSD